MLFSYGLGVLARARIMLLNVWVENPSVSRFPSPWRVFRVALLLGFLSFASRELNLSSWSAGGVTILWPSNGLLLGILLCSSKRHWPIYLTIAGVIDLSMNHSLGDPLYIAFYLSFCNLFEATLGALLLYRAIAPKPDLTQRSQLVAFLGYGVVLAPLVASFVASFAQNGYFAPTSFHNVHRWFTGDALGIATVTPLYLAFHGKDRLGNRSWLEIVGLFALLGVVTFGVFWQSQFPLLFLLLPFLLWLGLRLRLAGSALGLLLVAILGGILAATGHGPASVVYGQSPPARDLVFQVFIAVSMLLLYIVEVRLAESERLRASVEGSERRFRLLAEASNDIIFRCDFSGRRVYVSPSVTDVLGWSPEEMLAGTYEDLVHPDERAALTRMLETFRQVKVFPPRVEFRYRKADGSYLWLEFNLNLIYDDNSGEPAGYVNIARDISGRKLEEADFQRSLATAEQLASSDPLTGIANRRLFDQVIEREWLRAARERTKLSILLLDIDHFKLYNDVKGHLTGDQCLRQAVAAILPVVSRPADLLARYGGEEFVVVLPNTDATGARQMAEWIREAVETLRMPHEGNPPYGVLTVSVGCATMIPHPQISHLQLLETADQALYRAKSNGRNCVQMAEVQPGTSSVLVTG
jgi:diguanylate cyclase (GGDEF)-like protein/PAS domain S-box-containing protein